MEATPDLSLNQWSCALTMLRSSNSLRATSTNPRRYWRGPREPEVEEIKYVRGISPAWLLRLPKLRELWQNGMSTSQIGAALGVSKNAVVSVTHRVNLGARPSPIVRAAEGEVVATSPMRPQGWQPLPAFHAITWSAISDTPVPPWALVR